MSQYAHTRRKGMQYARAPHQLRFKARRKVKRVVVYTMETCPPCVADFLATMIDQVKISMALQHSEQKHKLSQIASAIWRIIKKKIIDLTGFVAQQLSLQKLEARSTCIRFKFLLGSDVVPVWISEGELSSSII